MCGVRSPPPLVDNRTPAPEDSFLVASVARTAPLKFGSRVPPSSGPILKTLAVSAVDILGPPSRTASAPDAPHVLRQSQMGSSSERPPTMGDRRLSPVWMPVSRGGPEVFSSASWKLALLKETTLLPGKLLRSKPRRRRAPSGTLTGTVRNTIAWQRPSRRPGNKAFEHQLK
ncbi:hypothetical protein HPB47_003007 [Ixodes persulcatus]|uniref:Uncharacterized protein n=1 Tax=Ixodes persulcatus TaxID=34615 RepID=A0AC60R082_IXOPE|nr:hypothetical protein HPB47_003007 [Ixodes persulcatus]